MALPGPDRVTALLAAIGGLAAVLVLLRVSEWGGAAAGGRDSVLYVTAARNLLDGNGLTTGGVPYQGLAPLFPLALAGAGLLFGPDPLGSAGWLNAAAFGLTAFATAAWVRSRTRSGFLAVWAGLACAFSVPLARIVSPAMTEALFVMFAVLSLYALDRWLDAVAGDGDDRRRTSLLLTAAACAALACATRYLGLALVLGALPLVLLADGRRLRPTRRGAADAALFAAVALPPLGAWMLRGLLTAGSATGRFYPTGWDTSAAADVLTGGIARLALGERGFALLGELAAALPYGGDGAAVALRAVAVLALAGGAAASLPLLSRRERLGLAVPAAFAAAYAPAPPTSASRSPATASARAGAALPSATSRTTPWRASSPASGRRSGAICGPCAFPRRASSGTRSSRASGSRASRPSPRASRRAARGVRAARRGAHADLRARGVLGGGRRRPLLRPCLRLGRRA